MFDDLFVDLVYMQVMQRLMLARMRKLKKVIRDATINCYAHIWHEAILAAGTLRQSRALEEMKSYLYRFARQMLYSEYNLVEDCVQETLITIVAQADKVYDPGALPNWSTMVLRNHMSKHNRKRARRLIDPDTGEPIWQPIEITLSDLTDKTRGEDSEETLARLVGAETETQFAMSVDLFALLETAVRNCVPNGLQQEAFIRCYLHNKLHSVVAAELGIEVDQLSMLKHRAIKKLKKCPPFLAILEDYL